eukprot:gnl/Dysnectes_brevis/568_a627_3299.p1 GENE.gnl/Dysnectes_brevis/568_a627_3299~~gnl/Dysnectes_brevis/568_a627_3299.p1  ORF type:complete len:484 (-),score=152.62 gnl/Dysnectes_brevis/568_a627_3299:101-1513(-)
MSVLKNDPELSESSSSSESSEDFGLSKDIKSREDLHLNYGDTVVMPSLCMHCHAQGRTKMLVIDIPKFRQMIISSFRCFHCGFEGRDISQAADIQDKASKTTLTVTSGKDLSRGVVKSSHCSVSIPSIAFEISPLPMSGQYTTVEGLVTSAIEGLSMLQPQRRLANPEVAAKIDETISGLRALLDTHDFKLILDDPSGNSFIEPLEQPDTGLRVEQYYRSDSQAKAVGLNMEQEKVIQRQSRAAAVVDHRKIDDIEVMVRDSSEDIMVLPGVCPACRADCGNKMLQIRIPYFRECLLMAAKCEDCGFKSIEVKSAGAIAPNGRRTVLHVRDPSDLSRDVLKSDSASVVIPELELELSPGTMGGVYTTVEGLLTMVRDELTKLAQFNIGDGGRDTEEGMKWRHVLSSLDRYSKGGEEFTLIIDDVLDASFIKNVYAPEADPDMEIEVYERTPEQNAEYGLDMMNTEDFETE